MSRYGKLMAGLVGVWLVWSVAASALHFYKAGPDGYPLRVGLAAIIPIALFLVSFFRSQRFREFTLALNPRSLTMAQSLRVQGFVFLVLASYGILPRVFAWPAGWGDIFIGATAFLVALNWANAGHRRSFIFWQLLGIADLVNAVTLGTIAQVIDPHGIPTSAMTVLPLSLIPTFFVPLFLILHVICIAQAVRWQAEQPVAQQRFSAAV
jgi:hypothetical protein